MLELFVKAKITTTKMLNLSADGCPAEISAENYLLMTKVT
jgi:hypothetical protein